MNQIWVSGDWHLFNRDPFDKRHPTRTPDEFKTMYDNYVSTIKEGDLFLFLGDLCDVETATDEELDLIKSLLHAIPGYKIMMRGNHDTMDDYFYLMLGFDEICEIGKCHHLIFSHQPCLVGIDEINIHAHLHSEKDHMLNFQHMNVWKWTELNGTPDKPVLLQDLFDLYDKIGNTAEPSWGDPDIYHSKDKLSPWKKLSYYSEKDVLDFSDKFTLAPMDESAGDRTMEEIIHLNDRLNGFKYGFRSDDGISDEYLSDYRVLSPIKFERARGGVCWDFAVYQADYFRKNFPSVLFTMWYVIFDVGPYWPTHTFMTFRYEGKTYYFESSFKRCAGVWEVESEEDAVNFVMHEMASIDTGVDDLLSHDYYVYRYNALDTRIPGMSAPEFMKHIEKKGHPVKHVYRDDYTVSLYSPINESADTSDGILDEVLFQDIEQTKRWLADDDAYQNELDATEYSDSRKPTKMRGKNDVIAESSKRKVYNDPTELHKPDRAESNKIAKKYDIPNVGRTTPEEYEEARKSPEERSAERRERQLTQLQRARSVKKRKSIVRKVKSKIPFVKNETVADESDVSDYDSTEHSPLYGDRKHFFYNYDMPKEENTSAEKITINESASLTSYRSIARRIHSYTESKKNDVVGNQNCMLCTWAFELSCRGQQTNPRPVYSPRDIIFSIAGESIVKNPVRIHFTTKTELSRIVKEAGNNARFYIHVNWNNCTGGHEFIILNNSGKVVVVDPQTGYVGDIDSRGSATYFDINYANSYLCRLDDKVIDANTLKYNDITYLTEWDEDIDIPYMKEHNMLDESVDSLDEGVLSDAIKDLPAIINNLSADAMYTGNWAKELRRSTNESSIQVVNEMAYEDYCDHFYAKLKSLAAEYNRREDIFKHTAKILKCDQKDLPKFECRIETSSEKQLCFSMVNPDTSFEIKCEYEKYLKEMIKELEKEAKEYPGAKSIWTADAEGTIYVNLELGQLNEAAIKRVSDDGKPVPKTCPKCGAKIGLYLKGEPVWLCSNQKCGTYYGTAPMNESAMCSVPLYYLSYENLHDDLYPVGKCLFTTIDQAVSEVVWESKNRHPQNKTRIPCDMFVHVTEPGYYELRSSDQVCGAKWSIDNITLNCIGRVHINADGSYDLDLDRVNESHQNEIVVKAKETTNPNDGESNKAVELTFYLDNQKIGEAGVSGYDTGKGFLYNMEVEKSYRGRGYGKYILNYVMQYYSVTDLSVAVNNDTAIHLYEKAGFRRKKTFRSNGENGYEKGRFHWYQLAETMSESTHASTVDDDHVQGKQYDLRDFTQITVTEEWLRSMKKSYKFLSHIPATKQGVDTIAWMDHNQLVAIVSVDTEPSKRERIWIHNIQVANEYRGHGLSKQILRYVIDKYKTNALAVKSDNLLAHKVYQDIGFIFGSGPDDIMGDSRIMYLDNGTVYHGSPLKLNVLKPQNRSLEERDYVFASPDRNFALCYAGNAWNDFMINQSYLNGKLTLIEIEPDAFEKAFNTPGYLYALDGNDFPIRRSSREVMTDRPVKPKSIKRIPNVYNEIKHSGIQLYHYGTWPKDHIFKSREEYLADRTEKFKQHIQESYQFELVNKTLRFMDPINESVNKTEKLYPVYIMLVHSGTAVSNVIKKVSHSEYSHASISFDSSMSKMYSFARKDPKNPFIGGFRYESIGKGFYEKKEVPYGVYVVPCTEDQIKRMKKRLAYFEKNQEKFTFDFVGLVTNYAGIVNNPAYSWFCSRFVADILNAGSPEGKVYVPEPSLQDPDDFKRAVFARYVTSGNNLMEYNQKEVDRATKRILRAEEMYREQLNESVHYNRFDPTDPYAVTVMRYQLSNMNEAVMDEFLRYIKSFHVELDPNGNVILTRRVYNQLDHHFIQTKQALKTMKKAGDLEGMKENLTKLYYMIQLITDQYMDKKTVSISKTVKKDMIDLRSVMLNVFQQNLQYVEEMDPKFNFQSYYDGSVYGKKTKIPISGITSIGKTLGTLL